ncbi:hypothetical protein F4553_000069 [Allocatelliglobosispora scoriae]|uniref:Uncharacterized protein n=1 Tax=Allocatelliglobosispora scoriae TaxID=643052 RepID=A0A841BIQ0_9ACTN|nr:hypothetical protein [Allocatelliglobosispora scoriae]MBB5866690.1 hypothetical protein [Allocatelliglobosispora scoriae]
MILGIASAVHAFLTYQRDINPNVTTDIVRPTFGTVQAVVASAAPGVVTVVSFDAVKGWDPHADADPRGRHLLSVEVILPAPPTDPPTVAAIILRGDVVAVNEFISGPATAKYRENSEYDVYVAAAADADPQTGRAVARFRVETRAQYGWCGRTQCFIQAPTVDSPLLEPRLAAANGDPRVDIGSWWRTYTNPQPLHNEPTTVAGTLIVEAGRLPLTATLASSSPPASMTNNQRLEWRSDARFSATATLTEGEMEATRQDRLFLVGVEIGAATALIPWGLQLLVDLAPTRCRREP